jgi:hypothetical protein
LRKKRIATLVAASLLLAILAIGSGAPAQADTTTITTWSDTYSLQKQPTSVHNGDTFDLMNGSATQGARSYAKFDVQALPAGATGITCSLILRALQNDASVIISARATTTTWDAGTLTWNNQPPLGAVLGTKTGMSNGQDFTIPLASGCPQTNGQWAAQLTVNLSNAKGWKVSSLDAGIAPPRMSLSWTPQATTTTAAPTTTTEAPTTTTEPPTTIAPTTTTAETTTTAAVTTTTLIGPPPLRFPRPAWCLAAPAYPVTGGSVVDPPAGADVRLVFPTDQAVHERVIVNGGQRVCVVGGETDIVSSFPNPDQQNGLWVRNDPSDVNDKVLELWVEGWYYHSSADPALLLNNDGLKTFTGFADVVLQNDRIETRGTNLGYHSDAVQLVSGQNSITYDMVTEYCELHCQMFSSDSSTTDANTYNFGRVDMHAILTADTSARALNFIDSDLDLRGPIHLGTELYLEPRLSSSVESSVAPAAGFDQTGTSPNQIDTPNAAFWAGVNGGILVDGVIKQQNGSIVNVPTPENGGNVGKGYIQP